MIKAFRRRLGFYERSGRGVGFLRLFKAGYIKSAHLGVDGRAVRIGDEKTGKWGYIDKQGKMVINPQFDSTESFAKGLAAVRNGDKWGYISR